jgi:hypothetical protein
VVEDPVKGKVFEFDGSGGITVDSAPAVRDAWSLSFWMKRAADTDMAILTPNLNRNDTLGSVEGGTKVSWWRGQVAVSITRKPALAVPLAKEIPVGRWFHVLITADENLAIYIDGKKRASAYHDSNAGTHPWFDFRRAPEFELFNGFKGRVSQLEFWNGIATEAIETL